MLSEDFVVESSTNADPLLCGDLTLKAAYSTAAAFIGESDTPLAFNASTNTFSIFSEVALIIYSEVPYFLSAEFKDYPKATYPDAPSSVTLSKKIKFLYPCDSIVKVTPTTQTDVTPNYYEGIEQNFVLTPFTVTPDYCDDTIVYSLKSVSGPGKTLDTKETLFDYLSIFSSSFSDGNGSVVALTDDYFD